MIETLKATVARSNARPAPDHPVIQGTAFLVSPTMVLTCAHCLGTKNAAASEVELHFSRWQDGERDQTAQVVHIDWELDVALLQLGKETTVEPLPCPKALKDDDLWKSFGYPSQVDTDGIVFSGMVKDCDARLFEKKVIQLQCTEARDKVRGASGTPVSVDGEIVGILTNQLLQYVHQDDRQETKPAFEVLYALPMQLIIRQEWYRNFIRSAPASRHERIVRQADAALAAITAERIASERKYVEGRYVNREPIEAAFVEFMNQEARCCFLAIGKAGAGKTTTLSYLALHAKRGPAVFVRGGIEEYSKDAIVEFLSSTLIDPHDSSLKRARSWDELLTALRECKTVITIFIDAINETEFGKIKSRRAELELLLEFAAKLPLRVVVSCRDVFWSYFIDARGQSNDFWWKFVYDPTYDLRLTAEIERIQQSLEKAAGSTARQTSEPEKKKEADRIRELAVRNTCHRPTVLIGDFSEKELSQALGTYGLAIDDAQLRGYLQHPLLLHLCSEFSAQELTDHQNLSLSEMFERYVDFKIASVKKAHPTFDQSITERLLSRLTHAMRVSHHAKISIDEMAQLIGEDKDCEAIKTYLLDEGIILELKTERLIGFQFDALFEFMLSREIELDFSGAPPERTVPRVLAEAKQFESVVGGLEFFFSRFETRDPSFCLAVLRQFTSGDSFAKETFLRILTRLKAPSNPAVVDSIHLAFSESDVDQELGLEAVSGIIEEDLQWGLAFIRSLVRSGTPFAQMRAARLVGYLSSSRDRLSIAVEMLKSPSFDTAAAIVSELYESSIRAPTLFPERHYRNRKTDLTPLLTELVSNDISFAGLLLATGHLLDELVDVAPKRTIAKIVRLLMTRPEWTPVLHLVRLQDLVVALCRAKSNDLLEIVQDQEIKPEFRVAMVGLLLTAQIEAPGHRIWLASNLLREEIRRGTWEGCGWLLLLGSYEHGSGIADQVAEQLSDSEASAMWGELSRFGIVPGGRRISVGTVIFMPMVTLAVFSSVVYYFSCFASSLDWQRTPGPALMTIALLTACAGFGVLLACFPVMNKTILRFRWIVSLTAATVTGLLVGWQPIWLTRSAAVVVLALVLAELFGAREKLRKPFFAVVRILAGMCLGLVAAQPLRWTAHWLPWSWSLVTIAVVHAAMKLKVGSVPAFAPSLAMVAVARAGFFVWLCHAFGVTNRVTLVNILALAATVALGHATAAVIYTSHNEGTIGRFTHVRLAWPPMVAFATAAVLLFFKCWTWALAIFALSAHLFLPIRSVDRWSKLLSPAIEQTVFGLLAGLLMYASWSAANGLAALFALAVFYNFLAISPSLVFVTIMVWNLHRKLGTANADSRV